MTFPTEPTEPLPTWATNVGAVKADPGATKRGTGYTTITGSGIGEPPLLKTFNYNAFANGKWVTYCKNALDYIKAGNFDSGLNVTGNMLISGGITTGAAETVNCGNITTHGPINIRSGNTLYMFRGANDVATTISASASQSGTIDYQWPAAGATAPYQYLCSNNSGIWFWNNLSLSGASSSVGSATVSTDADQQLATVVIPSTGTYLICINAEGAPTSGGANFYEFCLNSVSGFSGSTATQNYCRAPGAGGSASASQIASFSGGQTLYAMGRGNGVGGGDVSLTASAYAIKIG